MRVIATAENGDGDRSRTLDWNCRKEKNSDYTFLLCESAIDKIC